MKTDGLTPSELEKEIKRLKEDYTSTVELYESRINELKLSESNLHKNEEIFRTAYSTSPDAINITRLSDGKYVSVNEGFTKLLGYTAAESVGRTSLEMNIWADPLDRVKMVNEIKANGGIKNFETRFLSRNGTIVVGLVAASLIELEGVPHILTVTRDITIRKKAEEALAKERFLIDALMDSLTDHVYFKDLSSKFVRNNKAHTLSFGLKDPSELIGKSDFDFFTREAALQAFEDEQRIIRTGEIIQKEEKLTRKDQSDAWFSVIKMPLRDNEGKIIGTFGISRDITERKKSEEQLLLLADALKSINECVTITDMNDRVIFLNQAFIDTYGFQKEDLLKESISLIRSPNNPPEIINEILPATIKGGWHGELLNRRKDGSEFPIFLSTAVVRNLSGDPIAMIGVAKDITETKKTEAALKLSEERFRAVTYSANDGIISINENGIVTSWNKGATDIFGYTESEVMGQSLEKMVPPEYKGLHANALKRLAEGGERHVIGKTIEMTARRNDGRVIPVELSLSEWETSEGRFFTGIVRDISKRKRTEFENQILFEISQGVTTTSNLDELMKLIHSSLGKVVYAENIFVALFDQTTGLFSFPYFIDKIDETPLPISMSKSCSAYVYKTVRPLVLTQEVFDELVAMGEVELVGSNSPSWIGIPLQTPSRVIGVLVLQHYEKENVYSENDVNFLVSIGSHIAMAIERKKAEDEISAKNEQLQNLNAEKDKLFSIIAHDLRSPLSSFVGATQILTEEINTMTIQEIAEITHSMKLSASNIYNLLENLLEWSRLKRDGIDFVQEQLNLKKYVDACSTVFSEPARRKNIIIIVSVNDGIEVIADKHMLETVIRNLLSNAIKFSNPGGVISVSAHEIDGHFIEVKVSDSGIGIPPELKSKLFMINEKTSRKGTDGELSSGLGLLLCKEFIEKGGGRIWAESEEGRGTDFFFTVIQFKPYIK